MAARAEDLYIAQSDSGSADGSSCANAHAITWFTTPANWGAGAGKISTGDTVHLCGTITASATFQGGGITLLFEPGAIISRPANTLIFLDSMSDVVIDGGSNGYIEENANGSAPLANQVAVTAIHATSSSNVVVRNLGFKNIYVHSDPADHTIDEGAGGGYYANPQNGFLTITNCWFSNVCWCINMVNAGAAQTTSIHIQSNSFVNYDHGVALAPDANRFVTGDITGNSFGTTSNWDTAANKYHHDGIHYFGAVSNITPSLVISGNRFTGDWGANNTAHIYLEGGPANVSLINNLFIQWPGNFLNNGMVLNSGTNSVICNNTFVGSGVSLSSALKVGGTGAIVENNAFTGFTTFIYTGASGVTLGTIDYNVYENHISAGNSPWQLNGSSFNSLSAWKTATGQEAHSQTLAGNDLNGDGSPAAQSIVVNSGVALPSYLSTDILGIVRPQGPAWDIGAYEFTGHANIITGGSVLRNAVLQ